MAKIKNVVEYLERIDSIDRKEKTQFFYRGVNKRKYAKEAQNHPSIFRNENWIEKEDKMFYELVSTIPDEFENCQNTFECLVKMQHYNYPTRLLDITLSPLIALYFACIDDKSDGEVLVFEIEQSDIRNYSSDRVALLSNLALMPQEISPIIFMFNEMERLLKDFQKKVEGGQLRNENINLTMLINYLSELLPIYETIVNHQNFDSITDNTINIILASSILNFHLLVKSLVLFCNYKAPTSTGILQGIDDLTEKNFNKLKLLVCPTDTYDVLPTDIGNAVKNNDFVDFYRLFNARVLEGIESLRMNSNSRMFRKYSENISVNKTSWDSSFIEVKDMIGVQCVIPKQNNPRIIAQQGAFLVFGFWFC